MIVFERPKALADVKLHYCPGCTHGIIHRLVAEAIDELGIEGRTIGIAPVGCSVFAYNYFNCDMVEAARGENITIIFVNNAIYGMTGGQMAPTTLPGQVTQTSPYGRKVESVGYPLRVCELLSNVTGATYLERVAVNDVKNVRNAKRAIQKAFRYQMEGKGFSLIEVLSTCPTNWGLTPDKALKWLEENMIPYYPLGVYKDKYAEEAGK